VRVLELSIPGSRLDYAREDWVFKIENMLQMDLPNSLHNVALSLALYEEANAKKQQEKTTDAILAKRDARRQQEAAIEQEYKERFVLEMAQNEGFVSLEAFLAEAAKELGIQNDTG
jgi:hypothetical protein